MKTTKKCLALALAVITMLSLTFSVSAATWQQNSVGWWYQEDNGSYPVNTWKWIDGNNDGVAECYYFDGNGYMLSNTTTPDGYQVNASGAWVVNGVVQTQGTGSTGNAGHSANYDPAHPLAGKIDAWDLRLPTKYLGASEISSSNIQAMLTGQMDQYYMAPAGVSINPSTGTTMYIDEQDYNDNKTREQALYTWYCNWLNGMNFENMSEMDRAKEIQKVLGACHYDQNGFDNNSNFRYDYSVLINKTGVCEEFAMTACSLAKALGLKSAVSGSGTHAVYYIQVDGKTYGGQNQALNLDYVYTNVGFWN